MAVSSTYGKGVIYSIKDPDTNLVVYIGKSFDFIKRKSGHLNEFKHTKTKLNKKSIWIKSLLESGKRPIFEVIDDCTKSDWEQKERQYIKIFKSLGANLFNITDGGEAGSMGHKRTQEEKEYYRKLYTGRKNSNEQRLLNSIALKEKWKNDIVYREKHRIISTNNLKKITPEQTKIAIAKKNINNAKKI